MAKRSTHKAREFEESIIRYARKLHNLDPEIRIVAGARFGENHKSCKTNIPYRTEKEIEKCFDKRIKTRLKKIGKLGESPQRGGHRLGNCAEQNACNEILKECPKISIKQIKYSLAYRPRTVEVCPYCLNCIEVLGVKNR